LGDEPSLVTYNVKTRSIRSDRVDPPVRFVKPSRTRDNTRALVLTNAEFIPGEVEIRINASREPVLTASIISDTNFCDYKTSEIPTFLFRDITKRKARKEIIRIKAYIPPRTVITALHLKEDTHKCPNTKMDTEKMLGISVVDTWKWGPIQEKSGNNGSCYK